MSSQLSPSGLNPSLDESADQKLKALPEVEQVAPMIYNLMDLTAEVKVRGLWLENRFQSLQLLSGKPSMSFSIPLLAEGLGIAFLAGLTAGAVPVCRGARLSPVEGL